MCQSRWRQSLLCVALVITLALGVTPAHAQVTDRPTPAPSSAFFTSNQTPTSLAWIDSVGNLLTDIQALAVGGHHTCALTTGGAVKCWGANDIGQLGNGTIDAWRATPTVVMGLGSGVQAITAGHDHTCALTTGGAVKCWGSTILHQVGEGTTPDYRTVPVDVVGLSEGVQAIAAGGYHTCALTADAGVKCWGANGDGQLGDGTLALRVTAVDVVGLGSGVKRIAAGGDHSCALTTAGAVKCWGANGSGQLGDGTTTARLSPVDVSGLSDVHAIAAGQFHTCALTVGSIAKCWGSNDYGQLGDGTTTARWTPADAGELDDVRAIDAGYLFTCAVTVDGEIKCWGNNTFGQLGDGTRTDRWTPAQLSELSGVQAIAAGSFHACALVAEGAVKCWGLNFFGQLGDGATVDRWSPTTVGGLDNGIMAITPGEAHTCVLGAGGGIKCWGRNNFGQLGDGTTTDRWMPANVNGLSGVQAIAAGGLHTCALLADGTVTCWGNNSFGQLGDLSGLSEVQTIAAGQNHTCALTTDGAVTCWGADHSGQLGELGGLSGVQAIAAGTVHTCAVVTGGNVKCWGDNGNGQLGDGTTTGHTVPESVSGLSEVQAVTAGQVHTCALTTDGAVKCWGNNVYGQLGDGTTLAIRTTPVYVSGLSDSVQAITAGAHHTCALVIGGTVECWGENVYGQLGDGTTTNRWTPVVVNGLSGVHAIAAGANFTCALTDEGGTKCWGGNRDGQLGVNPGWEPVDVVAGAICRLPIIAR